MVEPVPDVSVVIVNWNTRPLLADCLASLPPAAGPLHLETWVVDNGSTDGSQAMVTQRFPEVHLIANEWNQGFAAANNQALRQARGRFFLLLNSDARPEPGAIERLVQTLEDRPDIGIAAAQLLNADGSLQNSAAAGPSLATELLNKSLLRRLNPRRYATRFPPQAEPVEVESVIGACLMARAAMVERIGLLDEGFFFFLEETDWCRRARQAGWKVVCEPRARVFHLQGGSAGAVRAEARIEYWISRRRFFRKHHGRAACTFLNTGLLLRLGCNLAANTLAGLVYPRARCKARVSARLLRWYLAGAPATGWGLQPTPAEIPAHDPGAP